MEVGRALLLVGAALALCFAALGAVVLAQRDEDGIAVDALRSERLTLEVAKADRLDRDVDFAALTDFDWDRLYIADPRVDRDALDRALGFEFEGDVGFITGPLLIFVRDGELARFADYRGEGAFSGIRRPVAAFDRAHAVFTVDALIMRPKRTDGARRWRPSHARPRG